MGTLLVVRRAWALVGAAAMAIAACGSDATTSTVTSPSTNPAATTSTVTSPATSPDTSPDTITSPTPEPGEVLTLVGGGTFDAARLEQGPLALWFWAPG